MFLEMKQPLRAVDSPYMGGPGSGQGKIQLHFNIFIFNDLNDGGVDFLSGGRWLPAAFGRRVPSDPAGGRTPILLLGYDRELLSLAVMSRALPVSPSFKRCLVGVTTFLMGAKWVPRSHLLNRGRLSLLRHPD